MQLLNKREIFSNIPGVWGSDWKTERTLAGTQQTTAKQVVKGNLSLNDSIGCGFNSLLTLGFLCGHFRIRQKRRKPNAAAGEIQSVAPGVATGGRTQIPYYDDVVLKQEVELKENVAYGSF